MSSDHMSSVQSNEVVCLPQEPQIHNEAQDLLLLQDYAHRLTNTLRTLEDTHAVLQQTELLAGVFNEQDCRDIRTACCCLRSLRIRLEAILCHDGCSLRSRGSWLGGSLVSALSFVASAPSEVALCDFVVGCFLV